MIVPKPNFRSSITFRFFSSFGGSSLYTIGQVSELFGLPISTLRYYDKEGLFPTMQRESGIRKFGEKELEALRVIECLKKSGLEIKDIKQFIAWCVQGSETDPQRREEIRRAYEHAHSMDA